MENLKINTGHAKATLSELRELIRRQREVLLNGQTSAGRVPARQAQTDLAFELQTWEELLQQLQTEMLLEKSAQVSLLYEVSHSINASLDWRRTLQAVMDAVIRITEAERGMLLVVDEQGEYQVEMTGNVTGEAFTESDMQFSDSIVSEVLQRHRPILTTNAQVDPRFEGSESIMAYGLRSILCAPLIDGDTPLGVIYLDNRARAGVFTREDLAMLAAFANQATIALANAREHKRTDQQLDERVRELTILQEMVRDLNASLRFERVMERSVSWIIAAASAEAGALALIAEEGLRWVSVVGNVQPDTHFAMRSVYDREPILEEDRLALPLLRDERPIGVLYVSTETRPLQEQKLEFVVRVADNAAIAVENARLYEALRQANQAKSEFVSLVSHELRTPMTSIRGYADMLSRGLGGQLEPRQQEFVEAIRCNTRRMHILVSDLLDISRIETGRLQLSPRPTAINDALTEALKTVQEMLSQREQELELAIWPHLPPAYADPNRLTQILINLLSNASKYTPDYGKITVRAELSVAEPDVIRCAVIDNGIGISPADQAHLFTKFFRADNSEVREQPGTGLGLAITKNLVEMQGGRIWVESEPGVGSTFYFTLPAALPGEQLTPIPRSRP